MGRIQPSACRGQSANYPLDPSFSLQRQETLVPALLLHAQPRLSWKRNSGLRCPTLQSWDQPTYTQDVMSELLIQLWVA